MTVKHCALCVALSLLVFPGCPKSGPTQKTQDEKSSTATSGTTENKTQAEQPPPRPKQPQAKRQRRPIYAGAHILLAYKGAMRARPNVTRTKDEALKLAKELAEKAKKDPSSFADLARKNSDGPSAPKGGDLGAWPKGRMVPAFDEAISKLKIGEVSDPVETPFGYHVMMRKAPPPMYSGAHILLAYKGAMRARPNVTRTKEEALKLAKEVAAKAKQDPSSFADLARKYSDGPSGPRGGHLGTWPKGQMVPAFDEAISKLKVGEVSDPVETPFGYHVMLRKAPAGQ